MRKPNKRKLNNLHVRSVQPRERAFLVWDTKQPGLALRVEPTGRKSWYVVYRFNKRPRWLRLANAYAITEKDARKRATEVMFQVSGGRDPAAERRAEHGAGTFAELATTYVELYAKKRNKSWPQADSLVRRYLLPLWAKLPVKSITRAEVRSAIGKIAAPIAANQTLAAASAIFSWAVKQELIPFNPARGVERNPTQRRKRVLDDSELPTFWKAFDDVGLVRGSALKVLLLTGQRPGEVCHMRREHLKGEWWEMPGKPDAVWPGTKNGEDHRVWLPRPARAIIAELDNGVPGFVFTNDSQRPITELHGAMREVCKALKAERVTPHDLRRTHGTTITALGFGREAMNRIQNHREGGIADVYDQHKYADENRRVMEAVANQIMALALGSTGPSNVVHAQF
jgi:integrase